MVLLVPLVLLTLVLVCGSSLLELGLLTRCAQCVTMILRPTCLCPFRPATAPCLCRRLRRCPTLVWLGVPCCMPLSWSAGLRPTGGPSGTSRRAVRGVSLTRARRLEVHGLPFEWSGATTRRDPGWRPTIAITTSQRSASPTEVTLRTGHGPCLRLLGRGRTAGRRGRGHTRLWLARLPRTWYALLADAAATARSPGPCGPGR